MCYNMNMCNKKKSVGKPRKYSGEDCEYTSMRLPVSVKNTYKEKAKKNNTSLTEEVVKKLIEEEKNE